MRKNRKIRAINVPHAASWINSKHASQLHGIYLAVAEAMQRSGVKPELALLSRVKPTSMIPGSQQIVLYCDNFDLDAVPELAKAPHHDPSQVKKEQTQETRKLQKLHAVIVARYQQCKVALPE